MALATAIEERLGLEAQQPPKFVMKLFAEQTEGAVVTLCFPEVLLMDAMPAGCVTPAGALYLDTCVVEASQQVKLLQPPR